MLIRLDHPSVANSDAARVVRKEAVTTQFSILKHLPNIGELGAELVLTSMAREASFSRVYCTWNVSAIPKGDPQMLSVKVIVEKRSDGYVAYPLGLKGLVVGEGDTLEAALSDVKSAIQCHIDTFGLDVFESDSQALEVFVAEVSVTLPAQ